MSQDLCIRIYALGDYLPCRILCPDGAYTKEAFNIAREFANASEIRNKCAKKEEMIERLKSLCASIDMYTSYICTFPEDIRECDDWSDGSMVIDYDHCVIYSDVYYIYWSYDEYKEAKENDGEYFVSEEDIKKTVINPERFEFDELDKIIRCMEKLPNVFMYKDRIYEKIK